MSTSSITLQAPSAVSIAEGRLNANQLIAQRRAVTEAMATVMKEGTDYGTIPGTPKPTLYKPGSEKILSMFHLAAEPRVEDLSTPDRIHYRVFVTITHAPSGVVLGTGIGEASSAESKYQWRAVLCDEEWNDTPEDRRRTKWKKGERNAYCIRQVRADMDDVANCVTPETLILTHDLQWVPAGEIQTGDMLIGVEEGLTNDYARHFAVGKAEVYGRRTDELYEITFADGRSVRCNGEHQWLVKKVGLKGTEWVSTQDILREITERKGRPRKWTVMSVCQPWSEDTSKEAGYIAGLLDADGSLGVGAVRVVFAQQWNSVLLGIQQALNDRGYRVSISAHKTQDELDQTGSGKQVYQVRLLGELCEQMRLLGSIRPPRLLERWLTMVNLSERRLEGRGSGSGKPVEIVSIESVGLGEIVMLGTSCRTYIAQGLVCHNTILKMAKKRAQIDATLTCTAASDMFSQDIEDLKDAGLDPQASDDATPKSEPLPQTLPPKQPPAQGTTAQPSQPTHAQATASVQSHGETISEGEAKRFWAIASTRTNDYRLIMDYLKAVQGVTNKSQILKSRYKEAILWAETGRTE